MSGSNAAYTMSKIDPIHPSSALDGPMVDCECHGITLTKGHDVRPRLHARPLLCNHELTPREIFVWLRQQDRDL
jgi:hypothetical protein